MIAAHRDSEITFYEELGVTPQASPDEIRDAFRLMVRLLHPDQQTDPQLKEIAEIQMRKLNRIYAVLSDPVSRIRYDEILDENYSPAGSSPFHLRTIAPKLAWAGATVLSAGLLVWLLSYSTPSVLSRMQDPNGVTASTASVPPGKLAGDESVPPQSQVSQLRSDLNAVTVERDAAIGELNRLRGDSQGTSQSNSQIPKSGVSPPAQGTKAGSAVTITELPSAPGLPLFPNAAIPSGERSANRQLAGFWFYARPPRGQTNKNQALYPPEFIEASITEDGGGLIHGRLHSRFEIVDRVISPDVNFSFTGTTNGSQSNCAWTGAGGAKGELTMTLTSENSLRIDWTATDLGSQQGLNSGTAVLTRRIE